jgi:hypothetical protein
VFGQGPAQLLGINVTHSLLLAGCLTLETSGQLLRGGLVRVTGYFLDDASGVAVFNPPFLPRDKAALAVFCHLCKDGFPVAVAVADMWLALVLDDFGAGREGLDVLWLVYAGHCRDPFSEPRRRRFPAQFWQRDGSAATQREFLAKTPFSTLVVVPTFLPSFNPSSTPTCDTCVPGSAQATSSLTKIARKWASTLPEFSNDRQTMMLASGQSARYAGRFFGTHHAPLYTSSSPFLEGSL